MTAPGVTEDLTSAAVPRPPSLFEQFMAEAVAPCELHIDGEVVVVACPPADAVCDLDHLLGVQDVTTWIADVSSDAAELCEGRPWTALLDTVAAIRDHYALIDLEPGTWTVLVEQIDLYGAELEVDLSDRGHDLLDWFRGRRPWPQLLRLARRLPPESHYKAALLDDDELAAERLDAEERGELERPADASRPPLVGESQERALLRAIASALPRIEHAVFAVNAPKGKAGTPPGPLPGPQTAEDRLRAHRGDSDVEDMIAAVAPWDARHRAPAGYAESGSGLLVPDR